MNAPDDSGGDPPVTGRCTRAVRIVRVDVVYRLLLRGLDRQEILEHVEKKCPGWGVKARAIDGYIASAKQLIIKASAADHDLELGRSLARRHSWITSLTDHGDYRGANVVQEKIDELLGLKAPIEINLTDARRELVELMLEEVMREAEEATAGAGSPD